MPINQLYEEPKSIMNSKMTQVANEIGRSILQKYDEDYLETLFSGGIVIEDIIMQILVECCRNAYLTKSEKHTLKYYIERDGLELDVQRKIIKRTMDYVRDHFEIVSTRVKESVGIDISKPDTRLVKQKNRYPNYELSEFDYWELNNIYDMDLVKAIVEKRIVSSKKISEKRFTDMVDQYDSVIKKMKEKDGLSPEDTIFASLVLFTLACKYPIEFFYELATEMERSGVAEIPDMGNRLECTVCTGKCTSCLPDISPDLAHDNDRQIKYPMILQRQRFVNHIVHLPEGNLNEVVFGMIIEANVLANAVQSHIFLNGIPMRQWFIENTNLDDWASVFEAYDVFRIFSNDKVWTRTKIQLVRRMFDAVSIDYKASRKVSLEK